MEKGRIEQVDPREVEPSTAHMRSEHGEPSPNFVTNVENVGIVLPLHGRYENGVLSLFDGVQRAQAAVAAGLSTVPVLVRALDDAEALAASLTLNDEDAGVRKTVADHDRDRSLSRAAAERCESEEDVRLRLGIWSEADRIQNALADVSGIGPKTAEALADAVGDLQAVREASLFELTAAEGVGERTARAIQHQLELADDDSLVVLHEEVR